MEWVGYSTVTELSLRDGRRADIVLDDLSDTASVVSAVDRLTNAVSAG